MGETGKSADSRASFTQEILVEGVEPGHLHFEQVFAWLLRWLGGKRVYLPMQEMLVQSLGQEDPLEKKMATHSSILAWRIAWTEEPGGLRSMGSQRVGQD